MGTATIADVEQGMGISERIVLGVRGMTCSGCEKKVMKGLQRIPAITNPKTSLVLAVVEFDLAVERTSVEDVIRQLRDYTHYTFEVVAGIDHSTEAMEILSSAPHAVDFVANIQGVIRAWLPSKSHVELIRVQYDSRIVGPRALLEIDLAPIDATLAPLRPHPSIATGRRETWRLGCMTVAFSILTLPILVFVWVPLATFRHWYYSLVSLILATIIQVGVGWEYYPSTFKSLVRSRVVEMDALVSLSTTAAYVLSVVFFSMLVKSRAKHEAPGESFQRDHHETFFETSALLATLVMLGRYVSELARHKALKSVSIRSLQPESALLLERRKDALSRESSLHNSIRTNVSSETDALTTRLVDIRLLQHGDEFRVLPHSTIPTDGEVISGTSEVNESMMTGESLPITKGPGSNVLAGTLNGNGTLDVALRSLPGENTIHKVAAMVDEAELSKPRTQAVADAVAGYFVPFILVVTMIVFLIWILVARYGQRLSTGDAAIKAVNYAIATLVVSCPCAIGLAVPMVVVIANGVAAKGGVIFKSSSVLETARNTTDIVFDKTGTLTVGQMVVTGFSYASLEQEKIESTVLGLVKNSTHPVAQAICRQLQSHAITATRLSNVSEIPGQGIEASLADGTAVRGGSARWIYHPKHTTETPAQHTPQRHSPCHESAQINHSCSDTVNRTLGQQRFPLFVDAIVESIVYDAESHGSGCRYTCCCISASVGRHDGKAPAIQGMAIVSGEETHFCVAIGTGVVAVYFLKDAPRPEAASTIEELQSRGTQVHLISGDSDGPVRSLATQLHINVANVKSRCSPRDKLTYVESLMKRNPKAKIMFCGDGTNDAPALAQAHIGVHVNSSTGTEMAKASASVVLAHPDLRGVIKIIDISKAAYTRIMFNFGWSFLYNLLAVLMAAGALVVWHIPPAFAGLGEAVSVLPVILIAFTLKVGKFGKSV